MDSSPNGLWLWTFNGDFTLFISSQETDKQISTQSSFVAVFFPSLSWFALCYLFTGRSNLASTLGYLEAWSSAFHEGVKLYDVMIWQVANLSACLTMDSQFLDVFSLWEYLWLFFCKFSYVFKYLRYILYFWGAWLSVGGTCISWS